MKDTKKFFTFLSLTLAVMPGFCAESGGKGSGAAAAFFQNIGDKIENKVHEDTDRKINKANEKKDVSATTTFMNNRLKLDKAFTKRYNELQPKGCGAGPVPTCESGGGHALTANSTNKTNKKSLEHYEQQMSRATSVQGLGQIYACAIQDYSECHYIGGAGSTAKTINGVAGAVDKVSKLGGKEGTNLLGSMDGDVRNVIASDNGTALDTDGGCEGSVIQGAKSTSDDYLGRLSRCEHIEQVTLSGYTDEDIRKLDEEYQNKKKTEQSLANRTLTATAIAATGIGTMELLQGRAEQKADKEAAESMAAYIATMRCTYGEDKQVKAGPDEIELPGGNNQDLMNYRAEYLALANDLKERKTALGMKPGIESEEIIDKAATGLYDDENLGITSGAYASLYRAQMLGSETDQAKIDEAAKTSKNRVLGGAIAAGAGLVIGVAGNSLINGKLGELIKQAKEKKAAKATKAEAEQEEKEALENLKQCLKNGGATGTDSLKFTNFPVSTLSFDGIDCYNNPWKEKVNGKTATSLFADTTDEAVITKKLVDSFGDEIALQLLSKIAHTECGIDNATICVGEGDSLKIVSCSDGYTPSSDGKKCEPKPE